ncbi:MAG: hypothetical protein EP301_08105 [Gammaproteobacteria bacterium]|jgi:uncharacterized membrane protein|nr:MAG: hypothetical protein EP301_08105 [Gammaproteobacteria bacterium]
MPLGVVICVILSTNACAESAPPEASGMQVSADPTFEPVTALYRCRGQEGDVIIVTRTRPNGLHVFLPPDTDGGYLDCEHDRRASIWEHAKLNGVNFRGLGNEPGWVLEIREGDRLDLSYDYGQGSLSVPITEARSDADARTTTYSGSTGERTLLVTLTGERCNDTMSDESFPTRVAVEFDGRKLSGCGRPLH